MALPFHVTAAACTPDFESTWLQVFVPATKSVVVTYGAKYLSGPGIDCSPGDAVFVVDDGGSDGLAWGVPRNITAQLSTMFSWMGHVVPGPGAGIVTDVVQPGRIVFSGSAGVYTHDMVYWSDDSGVTWNTTSTPLPLMDESSVVELRNGTLYITMRNAQAGARQAYSLSHDGGQTFTLPIAYDSTLVSPQCEASIARIGDRIYFANPASTHSRANITVRRSSGGSSLKWESTTVVVAPGPAWGGYSSMTGQAVTTDPNTGAPLAGILFERNATVNGNQTDVISFVLFPVDFQRLLRARGIRAAGRHSGCAETSASEQGDAASSHQCCSTMIGTQTC